MSGSIGGSSLFLTNPQLAIALRNQALAQPFVQQGTDYSPVRSPFQGLARVSNAIIGALMMKRAGDQMQSAVQGQNDALSDAMFRNNELMGGNGMAPPSGSGGPSSPNPSNMAPGSPANLPGAPGGAGGAPPPGPVAQGSDPYAPPPWVLAGVAQKESGGTPNPDVAVNSTTGAAGRYGILPSTAENPGYGVAPIALPDRLDPNKAQAFAGNYLAGRARAMYPDGFNWQNPQQAGSVLSAYGGDDSGAYGKSILQAAGMAPVQVAGPGAPTPQTAPGTPQGLPTGASAPMVQQGLALMQEAQRNLVSMDPRLQRLGQSQMARAQVLMQIDQWQPMQMGDMAGMGNARTGQFTPFPSDVQPNSHQIIQTPYGPADKNTLTGQTTLQFPRENIVTDPYGNQSVVTGGIQHPLNGGTGGPNGPQMPGVAAGAWKDMAEKDAQTVALDEQKASAGNNTMGTTQTIRSMLPQVSTGAGADARLRLAQIFTSLGISPQLAQQWSGTNAAPGEILQKKLFELTTGAVRGMGAREPGSVMTLFQKNYPQMTSRNMTIDAMTRLLDMDQVYHQDYAQGERAYLNDSVRGMSPQNGYRGIGGFQNQFNQSNSPRVYQAAALMTGGIPLNEWSQGLTQQQQVQAVRLARRVYPDFVPKGYAMAPTGTPPQ